MREVEEGREVEVAVTRARHKVLLAALVALAAVAGCGGGEEQGSLSADGQPPGVETGSSGHSGRSGDDTQRRSETVELSPEERDAERVVTDFYAILDAETTRNPNRVAIDSTSFCDLMSERAVAQTIDYAKVSSGIQQAWDCESAIELLLLRAKRAGGLAAVRRAEVVGVNAQGDHATATIRFGDGPATSIPLIREDGEWKLAANTVSPAR